ncbi:MAG: VOC family protein, partial [Gammaproteobacteria bacterium]
MAEARKARAVGVNHVAIEVGDIDEALSFYGRLFDFKLRGRKNMHEACIAIVLVTTIVNNLNTDQLGP